MTRPSIAPPPKAGFDLEVETLIIGAGAAGLTAALAARDEGREVVVVEADPVPRGSTALSAGLIPAAGTSFQRAAGIEDDTPALFAQDIQSKAKGQNAAELVEALTAAAGPAVEWLGESYGLPFSVVSDFDYPGHSRRRMHGLPDRAGLTLVDALRAAVETSGADMLTDARAEILYHEGRSIRGVGVSRPDGTRETIACARLILACNGFGGNRDMVSRHMPEIDAAVWFGHDGNRGDAMIWGEALGAATRHMGAYQGHGNVAHPHGILITWAVITEGGVQVNTEGRRFWDESQGYSEAARVVLAQPDGIAWTVFDDRIAKVARQFADFREAEARGAILSADTLEALATKAGLPAGELGSTILSLPHGTVDGFGRRFTDSALEPPYCAVRVTGALFHTQGGLVTDGQARVIAVDDVPFPNLWAAGGAACGVSGDGDTGYLSGNGLLAAVVLGRAAGMAN